MKKVILSLSLMLPVLANAQAAETTESSNLMPLALLVFGVGLITAVCFAAVAKSTHRKNEILNSNIERIKIELAAKGHDPETALINILHKESSVYKEPEPIIIYKDREDGDGDENILASLEEAVAEAPEEANHTLALKVADEIVRIQKNLSQMDESVKGLKQLNASVERIANNFAANGYEIVNMLNKPFNEGMKVEANFIPSEEIPTGQQIITRIIKPQVNFENKMIQAAQVEVSIGE